MDAHLPPVERRDGIKNSHQDSAKLEYAIGRLLDISSARMPFISSPLKPLASYNCILYVVPQRNRDPVPFFHASADQTLRKSIALRI